LPVAGSIVRLYDGDGNSCLAAVVRVDDELLWARPDWNTWRVPVEISESPTVDLLEALRKSVEAARTGGDPEPKVFELHEHTTPRR
jgi:hypothetical protein